MTVTAPKPLTLANTTGLVESESAWKRLFRSGPWSWWLALTLGAIVGTLLIGRSYRQSILTGAPSYPMFWAGVLIFMLPSVMFAIRRASQRTGLLAVTIATALYLYIPKLLRNPFAPVYHDELAHWRQVQQIAASGRLFVPNTTIPIIQFYPGLHIVAVTVQELSGLSIWSTAIALLACFHVVDMLAVFLIVEGFTHSSRAGAIGALIYSLNSSFMYFDTQFAYESLGIMLFLSTILAAQRAEQARARRARYAWSGIAVTIGCTCAVTHHLSTLCLCLLLAAWSAVSFLTRRRRHSTHPIFAITLCVCAFFASWIAFVAPSTVSYLDPYLRNGFSQLSGLLGGGHGGRTLFGQATGVSGPSIPNFEEFAAFLSPLLVLVASAVVLFRFRRRFNQRRPDGKPSRIASGRVTLMLFGLLYFPSIFFLLAPSGAEGARRSWAFSYLGIAVLLAPAISSAIAVRRHSIQRRWLRLSALLIGIVAVLIGNVAAGLDAAYRFPGPYAVGSDTRTQTPELAALATWFRTKIGPDNNVVSDRFTGLELGTYGQQRLDAPSAGFATYQLWLNRSVPSPLLINELSTSDYRYLVIDLRMDLPVSEASGFFSYSGAASTDGTSRITEQDLNRFANYDWLTRVYSSTDYAVYRFQFGSLGDASSAS